MTPVLLDTNLFARLASPHQPRYQEASAALQQLKRRNYQLCVAPQNIYELWVVMTRPVPNNGFGWSSTIALERLRKMTRFIRRLVDGPLVYREWLRLVRDYSILGKPAHDARLVAIMNVHQVEHIVTFNASDFARYSHLTVWTPAMAS